MVGTVPRESRLIQRYNAQFWQIEEDLSLTGGADPAVNSFAEQHKSKAQEYSTEKAYGRVHEQARAVRKKRRFCPVNNNNVAVAHSSCQACFLNLLQHYFVDVQVRFDIPLEGVVVDRLARLLINHLLLISAGLRQ